MPASNLEQGD